MSEELNQPESLRESIASLGGIASLFILFFLPLLLVSHPSAFEIVTAAVIFGFGFGLAVGCIRHSARNALIFMGAFSLSLYGVILLFFVNQSVDRLDAVWRFWRKILAG